MIEIYNRLLSFVNWTNPATETKSMWVGGRRAGALFFAFHRDYFVVTRNFTAIYLDLVPFNSFTVTRNSLPSTGPDSYREGKKQGTATTLKRGWL